MNNASNAGKGRRRPLAVLANMLMGLVVVTAAACSDALPTTSTPSETVVMHKYARGYAPADHGSDNSGPGNNNGTSGAAAACADTGTVSKDIDDNGGTLSLGGTTLVFPNHNGMKKTRITMALLPGTASVQFYPEGLVFGIFKQPVLTINTDCIGNPSNTDIVYTDNFGLILQWPTSFHLDSHSVSAYIPHFSRYAVDW